MIAERQNREKSVPRRQKKEKAIKVVKKTESNQYEDDDDDKDDDDSDYVDNEKDSINDAMTETKEALTVIETSAIRHSNSAAEASCYLINFVTDFDPISARKR